MATIRIDFSSSNILPDGYIVGKMGEHNATTLVITPPPEMAANPNVRCYYVAFETGGKVIHSDRLEKTETLSVPLWKQLTAHQTIKVQLEACDVYDAILCKSVLVSGLFFLPSVCGKETEANHSACAGDFGTARIIEINEIENTVPSDISIYNFFPTMFFSGSRTKIVRLYGIISLPSSAFQSWSYLEEVHGMELVKSIGSSCFYNCQNLKEINLSESVTTIDRYVFYNCYELEKLTAAGDITTINEYGMYRCSKLKNFDLSKVIYFGNNALQNCTLLEITELSPDITYIGSSVFSYCEKLNVTDLKASSAISSSAFSYCIGLKNLTVETPSIGTSAFYGCTGLKSLVIKCPSISGNAFSSCTALESVEIKGNPTYYANGIFQNCLSLQTVTFENDPYTYPSNMFQGCSNLDMMFIRTAGAIGNYAFSDTGLTAVAITAASIQQYAFSFCGSLYTASILPGCTTLGPYAFYQTGLEMVNIPDSVTSLGQSCFYRNSLLEEVSVPGVTNFSGASAFAYCTGLKSATLGSVGKAVTAIKNNLFQYDTQSDLTISVYVNNPSTPLQYQPWGATNATIEYLQA